VKTPGNTCGYGKLPAQSGSTICAADSINPSPDGCDSADASMLPVPAAFCCLGVQQPALGRAEARYDTENNEKCVLQIFSSQRLLAVNRLSAVRGVTSCQAEHPQELCSCLLINGTTFCDIGNQDEC
jgi:hypothetical protein